MTDLCPFFWLLVCSSSHREHFGLGGLACHLARVLGQGLAVPHRVDNDASVLEDGRSREVSEGTVGVVLPAKGLPYAALIGLFAVKGERHRWRGVCAHCLLVPLFTDGHKLQPLVSSPISSLFSLSLCFLLGLLHPFWVALLVLPHTPAWQGAGLLYVGQLSAHLCCLVSCKLSLHIIACKRHPDELLLRGLMAGGRRPHALLCFAASPPLVFLLLRLTAAIPSSPTHACIPASHTRLLPALTAAAAPASGELCTTPIGTIVARMIGCVASANCSRRVSIRYARDAHALLMLVFPGLAP
mmetsp:Transcript_12758/g.34785  ORF Transcript_12758/g.34785 Transcript_12758/m.34785 type:complete len:299 (-) Transcript_12758:458-1354(-)